MNIRILLLLTLSSLLGCKDTSNADANCVYFGGEIINPNNGYVVLNNPDEISDTLYLDAQNRFFKKLTSVKSGLYTFLHGSEYQRILLEPKDSLMLRLNTIDFDESLVYTGEGAKKNNYLISAFLENETDYKKFLRMMWDMEPTKFETILDSNRTDKLSKLEEFLSQREYSNLFKTIAKSSIDYDYYYYKELYPFSYYGYNNLIHYKDLPDGFYSFRKDVDYNNEALIGVNPYYRFLFNHFNNIALKKFYQNASHNVVFDNNSAIYNLEKLHLMDSLITNEKIKNHLLNFTTRDFIIVSKDSSETKEILNSFLQKSTSDTDKAYMQKLVSSVNKLRPGNVLPKINLIDYDDKVVEIDDLVTKPTVIYFWSSNLPLLLRNSHYKMKVLKSKFPELDFIAININNNDRVHWKNVINQYKFSTLNEYQFQNPKEALSQLVINSVNRSILVDGDGKIINSNAMLFTSEFEQELENVVNKKKDSPQIVNLFP